VIPDTWAFIQELTLVATFLPLMSEELDEALLEMLNLKGDKRKSMG
jgi:hypothetical protein